MKKQKTHKIWCSICKANVNAGLVHGDKVYPHRPDLKELPFWECPNCENTVGTHYKSTEPLKPLGVIASKEMKSARIEIHNMIDPIWKSGVMTRTQVYKFISQRLGYQYHTGELRSIEETNRVIEIIRQLRKGIRKDGFKI